MTAKLFPCTILALSLGASVVYFCQGDWRRGGYWLCGAGITFFVTF